MPSRNAWRVTAPDGTTTDHDTMRDALANYPEGASLKRERVFYSKGPQAKRPKVREDQPPVVPARRAPDPAPMPGERIDAFGNAIRD